MARILVVDDDEMDRLFERGLLEDEGHELYYAKDGEQALRAYKANAVDLVITDLHMPNLDGLGLVRELKALDPDVMIIAVSGIAMDRLELAEEHGAAYTLLKPIDPPEFLQCVREALDRGGAGRQP